MEGLLFFYAVEKEAYLQFVLPFLYFAEKYNPGSKFEIAVVNGDVPKWISDGLSIMKSPGDISVYSLESKSTAAISRWLFEPRTPSEFVYTGDIDIMISEPVAPYHVGRMEECGSCYSNTVRPNNSGRMSGLQFMSREWYARTRTAREKRISNKNSTRGMNDEVVLMDIVRESGLPVISEPRPVHGVHMSLHRKPFWKSSYMINVLPDEFRPQFEETVSEARFKLIVDACPMFRDTLSEFIEYVSGDASESDFRNAAGPVTG